ncbi:Hypothetical protein UVM_LOCUS297 [uncultured virus]|nr:Hypothetical protein UVM_LOCUS297 [uncultured virus]
MLCAALATAGLYYAVCSAKQRVDGRRWQEAVVREGKQKRRRRRPPPPPQSFGEGGDGYGYLGMQTILPPQSQEAASDAEAATSLRSEYGGKAPS